MVIADGNSVPGRAAAIAVQSADKASGSVRSSSDPVLAMAPLILYIGDAVIAPPAVDISTFATNEGCGRPELRRFLPKYWEITCRATSSI
ncbi:MAG: hypothetical protein R3D62_01115 [Xanthobacteraceae bacterium]